MLHSLWVCFESDLFQFWRRPAHLHGSAAQVACAPSSSAAQQLTLPAVGRGPLPSFSAHHRCEAEPVPFARVLRRWGWTAPLRPSRRRLKALTWTARPRRACEDASSFGGVSCRVGCCASGLTATGEARRAAHCELGVRTAPGHQPWYQLNAPVISLPSASAPSPSTDLSTHPLALLALPAASCTMMSCLAVLSSARSLLV